MSLLEDKELQHYRDLVKPPGVFQDGFGWKAVIGALFVGVVMLPASMYMSLVIGGTSVGPAATWVTVILFMEMAKRARTALSTAEIFIIMGMTGALIGGPVEGMFWRQYMVQSEAARSYGISDLFPSWWAPIDSGVLDKRSLFMWPWFVPLALIFLQSVISRIDSLVLGYGLFRVVSDFEKLPFPMAPLGATGVLALSENQSGNEGWRWRCFSIGTAFGLFFGFLYAAVPTLTSTFLREPFTLFPIPWLDISTKTQDWLPAVPMGITFDMGLFFFGMALPFFGVVGSLVGVVVMVVANPILHHYGMLPSWKKDMQTQEILFANGVDFYMSFGIGLGVAVALIGIWQCIGTLRAKRDQSLDQPVEVKPTPKQRGDIKNWVVIATYVVSSLFYLAMCGWLLGWDFKGSRLVWILLFFAFVYTPFISYVTARLEGLAGQALEIPFIKEAAFILSGYKGIELWLLPIPMSNYGYDVVGYRTSELLGTSFRSIWKQAAFSVPLVFLLSLLYAQFIWGMAPIPSANYPYAQQMWDLNARNQALVLSSTMGSFSPFLAALNPTIISAGCGLGLVAYAGLAAFGLPVLLVYGVVKGLGGSPPQSMILMFLGAIFGRYVMAKRFGPSAWSQYAPVLAAGYSCGAGLIVMVAVGIKFLSAAVFQLPY